MNATKDIASAFFWYPLWMALAWEDMRHRYRRTIFGLLWLTAAFLAFILAKYFVFSTVNAVAPEFFIVWLVVGYWVWNFMSGVTTDGCNIFANAKGWISGTPLPLPVYAFQSIARETITWGCTAIASIALVLWFGYPKGWVALAALPALPFFLFTALGVELLAGTLAAGARDIAQAVKTFMRVAYFLTPILWVPSGRPQLEWIAELNPFTHYIALFRTPIMENVVPWDNWIVAILSTSVIWMLALLAFGLNRKRIIYWL